MLTGWSSCCLTYWSFVYLRFFLAWRQWCLILGFKEPELNCLLSLFKSGRMGLSLVLTIISFSYGQKEPAGSTVTFAFFPSEPNTFFPQYFLLELREVQSSSAIFISDSTLPCHRTTSWPWNFVSQQVINVTTLVWTLRRQHINRVFTF